jgi:hypothetical protein
MYILIPCLISKSEYSAFVHHVTFYIRPVIDARAYSRKRHGEAKGEFGLVIHGESSELNHCNIF